MNTPAERHRALSQIRAKLPELLVEAASVLFAVLLALAVDEWRQDRADRALAQRAEQGIREEIRINREQLREVHPNHREIQASFATLLAASDEEEPDSLSVDFSIALLSNAAWETAQVTHAVHFMPYDRVTEISKLYQLQHLYDETQSGFVERLSSMGELEAKSPQHIVHALSGRLRTVLDLQEGLLESYAELLEDEPESPAR